MSLKKLMVLLILVALTTSCIVAATTGAPATNNLNKENKVRINNSVPIYYIGEKSLTSYFSQSRELKELGNVYGRHILIVDGKYAKNIKLNSLRSFLKREILSGVPVIVVNGNTRIVKRLFKGQFCPTVIGGRTPDGKPIGRETIYGYINYPIDNKTLVTKVFISTDSSPGIILEAYKWALSNMPSKRGASKSTAHYW